MERFCIDVSQTFFNEFGWISHQINSFDPSSEYSDALLLGRALINRAGEGGMPPFHMKKSG